MLERAVYSGWSYRQPGCQCVLAAYAAAVYPFTSQDALAYFRAYADHFGLSHVDAEAEYDRDFHSRANGHADGGFGVIRSLHECSSAFAFATAQARTVLAFLPDGENSWAAIDSALAAPGLATAEIFINDSLSGPFPSMHSVAVSRDTLGLYAYDSTQGLVSMSGVSQLGRIGHAFLFTAR